MAGSRGVDFEALAEQLAARAEQLVPQWLPRGQRRGREWVVGSLAGEPGDSLSVNLDTGKWADFADPEQAGGDLISLYAAIHGLSQADAARTLSGDSEGGQSRKRSGGRSRPVVGKPPADAPTPSFRHPKWGPASQHWAYHDADGSLIGYVSRHDPDSESGPGSASGVRKQIIPWSWDTKRQGWAMVAAPEPRQLYGLPGLAERPGAPVLVVEGEKAADAAHQLAGHVYVVVTWPGGSKVVKKADWSPLHGRQVLLWPDADATGRKAMEQVASLLAGHCPQIKLLEVDASGGDSGGDGWDAADALAEGWDWEKLKAWAKPRAQPWAQDPPAASPAAHTPDADPQDADEAAGDGGDIGSLIALWDRLGLELNSNGGPQTNLSNAARVLERHPDLAGRVWFDEFHGKIFTNWRGPLREWADPDDVALALFMQRRVGIGRMAVSTAHDAAVHVARQQPRNEVKQWLESLSWDGIARLEHLMSDGFGAERTHYAQRVGVCWMISMVARVYRPGCKVDTMPVFEGEQGIYKSSALQILAGQWFTECHESITSKDFYQVLQGKLIVEISELDAFRRAEVERIKGVISSAVDRYRAPYGRNTQDHPRQSVFAGTTNRKEWNQDETGARRFWPIRCGAIDRDWLMSCRSQLFAEAVARFKDGEDWWSVPQDEARAEQEARRQVDTWEETIHQYLLSRLSSHVTLAEVLEHGLKLEPGRQGRTEQLRAAACMRALGWESTVARLESGRPARIWQRKEG